MHAAFERDFSGAGTAADWHAHFPEPAPAPAQPAWEPSRYGRRRANLPAIGAILAVHAALLAALIAFDVIPLHRAPPPKPLVIELLKEVAPPPEIVQAKPVDPPIVAPTPVVRMDTPPPPVAVVESAPPVVATPVVVAVAPVAAPTPAPSTGPVDHPDVLPQTLSRAELRYPTESRRQKEQGTVVLQVLITTGGTVADIKVRQSSGFDRLDDAALASVKRWRFRAAQKDGQPVMAWGVVAIPFKIKA